MSINKLKANLKQALIADFDGLSKSREEIIDEEFSKFEKSRIGMSKEEAHKLMRSVLYGEVAFDVEEALNLILDSYKPDISIGMSREEVLEKLYQKNCVPINKDMATIDIKKHAQDEKVINWFFDEIYDSIEPKNVVAEYTTRDGYFVHSNGDNLDSQWVVDSLLNSTKNFIVTIQEKKDAQ